MVSSEQMNGNSFVSYFSNFPQQPDVTFRDNSFVFKPKIEHISHQENFGLVVAEALAVGTPVLISDKVNIWREISDGGAGFVQPDTQAGAQQLLSNWIGLSAEQQDQMSLAAKAVYLEHFEIRKATERLIAYIDTKLNA